MSHALRLQTVAIIDLVELRSSILGSRWPSVRYTYYSYCKQIVHSFTCWSQYFNKSFFIQNFLFSITSEIPRARDYAFPDIANSN